MRGVCFEASLQDRRGRQHTAAHGPHSIIDIGSYATGRLSGLLAVACAVDIHGCSTCLELIAKHKERYLIHNVPLLFVQTDTFAFMAGHLPAGILREFFCFSWTKCRRLRCEYF